MNIPSLQNSNYSGVYSVPPLKNESTGTTASSMPKNEMIVTEVNSNKRTLNNLTPNYIKNIYLANQSASNGSLTESFIRSRASLSPAYFHNEIKTRYEMISSIPIKPLNIHKTFERYV